MITPNWHPADRQLRQFAVACLAASALLGYTAASWGASWTAIIAILLLGAACGILGLVNPHLITPVYYALLTLSYPIGWLISNAILIVFFYLVMTPLAFFFRLASRDPLMLKSTTADSYWKPHEQRNDPESYFRQS